METRIVYITFEHAQAATDVAHALLEERLIACANILPESRSLYQWKGKLEETRETVMIAKTTAAHIDKIIDKVRGLHTYTCPCILSFQVSEGHAPFLQWVEEQTAQV